MAAKIPGNGVESSGAFTVGAAGTASNLAGIPFYKNDTGSVYTHDVSGTDSTANYNTAYGINALDAITTGDNNTVVGSAAGGGLTTGHRNTLMGQGAGILLTEATHTTAIGNAAASGYDTETNNIAIGHVALGGSVAGGEYNVAVGNFTLDALTSGDYNAFLGHNAGSGINSGSNNTGIGVEAGMDTTSGSNNTFLGGEAGRSSSPNQVTTGSNAVVVGNNSVATAHIKVDWTVTSDKRDKADIEPLTMGLDFVNALNPVTYRWDMRSDYENKTPDGTNKKAKLSGGLLAQDVEILEREYGYKVEDETSILTTVNSDGNYGLTYGKFVPVLINAVQDLSAQVTTLQEEINTLKEGN